jgi:N-acetyl-alpha-D-muramate 1-phosphate uridylyltransferase
MNLAVVDITAMIMAAGKGTRMMPLTADRPKPLVVVDGVALFDHVLTHLREAGIRNIVVNVHYMADKMEAHLFSHTNDFTFAVSDERALLRDTGGGLVKALPLIKSDPFLCVNADNWWTDNGENAFLRLLAAWDDETMDALMLVVPLAAASNTQGEGDFDIDATDRLSRRTPGSKAATVWTGIQLLSKRLIIDPPSDVFSTNIFWDSAIAAGRCYGIIHNGAWFDVGYPAAIGMTEHALEKHVAL